MLQAFATQLLFNKFENIESEIIDYRFAEKNKTKWQMVKIRVSRLLVYVKEFRRVWATKKYEPLKNKRKCLFEQFAKENLNLSSQTFHYEKELNKVAHYDIYLTGSDQTWSPKIGFSKFLFLDFAPKNTHKVAYAPSIGVTTFSDEEKAFIRKELQKYELLSCRESLGSELLSKVSGKYVETVLDPTLMILPEEWKKYATHPSIDGKYILCYFLGERNYYRNYVAQLSRQEGLPVYYIPVNWKDFKKSNNLLWNVGPSEFLGLIANAEYVCTDSFHGTIFGVNFHREVRVFVKHIGNVSGGDNSRLFDIVKRLGIEHLLITEYQKGTHIDDTHIDYSNVNERLSIERNRSMKYVKTIVSTVDV